VEQRNPASLAQFGDLCILAFKVAPGSPVKFSILLRSCHCALLKISAFNTDGQHFDGAVAPAECEREEHQS
jgi:hypothetical protein